MRTCFRLLLMACLLAALAPMAAAPEVAARERCFPEQADITNCLADPFSGYWEANGGLAVFGYPITSAQPERSAELSADLNTQWTERYRLEAHPENQPPYNILIGRMGAERLAQLGRDPAREAREAGQQPGCLWFEQTGHNVCNQGGSLGFRSYWEANGLNIPGLDSYGRSLQLFGLPLTAAQPEMAPDGKMIVVQWFERGRFEWHPGNPDQYKVLLGLLGREVRERQPRPLPGDTASIFGVAVNNGHGQRLADEARGSGVRWVRAGDALWSQVEPTRGARNWGALKSLDDSVLQVSAQGLTPVVVLFGTPQWASQGSSSTCVPMQPDALDAFATFARDTVARYSAPPYNVRHWQIWNEPDILPERAPPEGGYGCWAARQAPSYGGDYYAEMLKRVYPAIKQADPQSQVFMGGLILDCDPDYAPQGTDCSSTRFFEGVLRAGGGDYVDAISFHGYAYWTLNQENWEIANSSWGQRGGAVAGKLSYLRQLMGRYGVAKPVLLDEAALICYRSHPICQADFDQAQAEYAVRVYSRGWANGLHAVMWYSLNGPGWQKSGLLDEKDRPRPAYRTLQFLTSRLTGGRYDGNLSQGSVEGYAFAQGGARYEIYWTNDGQQAQVALGPGVVAVYDVLGQQVSGPAGELTVGFAPRIVERR